MSTKTFDVNCWRLANRFILDEPKLAGQQDKLAAHIQGAIEDFIEDAKLEACSGKVLDALVAEADSEGEKMAAVLERDDRFAME